MKFIEYKIPVNQQFNSSIHKIRKATKREIEKAYQKIGKPAPEVKK